MIFDRKKLLNIKYFDVCSVHFVDFMIFVQQVECYKKQIIANMYCAFVGQI